MAAIIGKKIGVTRVFDGSGQSVLVTVIEAGPCYVTQIKTMKTDGYDAVQLGFDDKKEKNSNKAEMGHFAKAKVAPKRVLREFREFGDSGELKLGDEVNVSVFNEGAIVTVAGRSKGKGFQGVVRRHGFGGGPKTHGQSDRLRAPGSLGQSSWPSRVFKGLKMAGRTGNDRVTVKDIKVVKIIPDRNVLMVQGAVPGPRSGFLTINAKV